MQVVQCLARQVFLFVVVLETYFYEFFADYEVVELVVALQVV